MAAPCGHGRAAARADAGGEPGGRVDERAAHGITGGGGLVARVAGVRPGAPGACVSRHDATLAREAGQAATGNYDNTRFALAREPRPLWSYRESKLAVSTVV